ncbi:hypothetical protein UlMin_021088 [Ulmus minor]
MDSIKAPFRGIFADFKGRKDCYKQDWQAGLRSGFRILAPTTYIFFASALPVIAFGEQLSKETDGSPTTVHTLASTAICGIIHTIIGGQPLLIVGSDDLGKELFLAWAGWVCVWTALFLFFLAIFNASAIIKRFTRIAGGLFGMLIAILFIQQAVKGKYQFQWIYVNGPLGIIFSFGLLFTALKSRRARSWRYGTGLLRSFIADYGVPFMVLIWSALSFSVPGGVPSDDMGRVPPVYISASFVPAMMIAGLYFFDHSVASQLAQQKEFNLKNPSSYHYDILILGFMTLLCGLIGLPPSKGVLPQSPMHTKALFGPRKLIRKKLVKSVKECMGSNASNSEIYGRRQAIFIEMDATTAWIINDFWSFLLGGRLYSPEGRSHETLIVNLICFAVTWIPIAAILFPLPFFLLISIRQHILPKLFDPLHLHELDAAEYEEISGAQTYHHGGSFKEVELNQSGDQESEAEEYDAEVLDELSTSRGEVKLRPRSFSDDTHGQARFL